MQDGVAFGCVSQLSLWVLLRIRERLWLCVDCCLCLTVVAADVAVVVVLSANAAVVIAIHIYQQKYEKSVSCNADKMFLKYRSPSFDIYNRNA